VGGWEGGGVLLLDLGCLYHIVGRTLAGRVRVQETGFYVGYIDMYVEYIDMYCSG
jgi:hypothetical protein